MVNMCPCLRVSQTVGTGRQERITPANDGHEQGQGSHGEHDALIKQ